MQDREKILNKYCRVKKREVAVYIYKIDEEKIKKEFGSIQNFLDYCVEKEFYADFINDFKDLGL